MSHGARSRPRASFGTHRPSLRARLSIMQLTKLGHSCVQLRKDGGTLVIDPGVWSGSGTLTGVNAVLVTHAHADHLDADALRFALAADADLQLWSHLPVPSQFAEFGSQVHAVSHGQSFTAAG